MREKNVKKTKETRHRIYRILKSSKNYVHKSLKKHKLFIFLILKKISEIQNHTPLNKSVTAVTKFSVIISKVEPLPIFEILPHDLKKTIITISDVGRCHKLKSEIHVFTLLELTND